MKGVLEGCWGWLADEQSSAKCWLRAEEEVKPCTSICKGVMPSEGGKLGFFLTLVQLSTPAVRRKKKKEKLRLKFSSRRET